MARDELQSFTQGWDEVEATLHMMTLLAARFVWDYRVSGC